MNFIKYNIKIQRLFIIALSEKLLHISRNPENRGITAPCRAIWLVARGSLPNYLLKSRAAACLHAGWRSGITANFIVSTLCVPYSGLYYRCYIICSYKGFSLQTGFSRAYKL